MLAKANCGEGGEFRIGGGVLQEFFGVVVAVVLEHFSPWRESLAGFLGGGLGGFDVFVGIIMQSDEGRA